ncbi:MAG: patatin-like phospholipase family protein [Planctomycetes bacterium]|nr:patatin-like phospholipase family protein [Planctomycetota bacterium]
MRRTTGCTLALAALALVGCAQFPENRELPPPYPARLGYRFDNLRADVANTDSVLVCVSFSGGGVRAGALAYGVVRRLAETRIAGGTRTLLDEVDIISAASGGAFPAAYYGVFGREAFLAEFRDRVLVRDLGMETFWRGTLCPYNLVRICSPWFNRSDLAAELYGATIFRGKTYADLQRRGRPFVVLNATDLALGERFEFTQDRFDRLGSSLSRVPVARAVAASSAFPVLLTPVAFRDFTVEGVRYVHLVDGGLVDNLGVGYVLDAYRRGVLRERVEAGRVETLVFIVVNARNRPPDEMGGSARAPGAIDVLSWGLSAAIDGRADDQGELLVDLAQRNGGAGSDAVTGPRVHVVEVDLDDLPDLERRERLLSVETTFGLKAEVIDDLIAAAEELLDRSDAFEQVLRELR